MFFLRQIVVNCISCLQVRMLIAGVPSGIRGVGRGAHANVERAFSDRV